jgi:hypothetical protein
MGSSGSAIETYRFLSGPKRGTKVGGHAQAMVQRSWRASDDAPAGYGQQISARKGVRGGRCFLLKAGKEPVSRQALPSSA